MESMSAVFAGAFKSERLVYRSMEDTEADRDWMWKNLWNNPVNVGLANLATFVPPSQRNFKKDWEQILSRALVAVFICLPPPKKAEGVDSDPADKAQEKDVKDDGSTIIGMICLSKYAIDTFKRRTGIGLQIADEYQNKGYGREAINWALDWAFNFGDMNKVEIGTASYNDRAAALYESIGFKREGVKRHAFFMNRKYWDIIDFGMLMDEWEELRGLKAEANDVPLGKK
ncbi:acyl-CoA N-acyltransferase [Truncatella angustata]|uniref:Acyl-CoA N-acyltransferase n=1 Tax=Truncatella angustata TaxID=152316 RepID=A0A9P9A2F7_9PEZI|nr:acyl-CoA N-acyltransferase [Truncatella angustata]KAH6658161.1 acyl-CoA N-acyltransferase [Truncatella angustata]